MTQVQNFKQNATVLDTETTNLSPELCEIVEVAGAKWDGSNWNAKGMLLGAYHGIPPEASAKNNISTRMIKDLPKFDQTIGTVKELLNWPHSKYFVAHNAAYDRAALTAAFTRMHGGSDAKICKDDSRWICTWRLSRRILVHDFADVQFGLNYLRYRLDLPVEDTIGVHRADQDTIVCAALLDKLIDISLDKGLLNENDDIGQQLVKMSWDYIPVTVWPLGKYRGQALSDVPNDYYVWALKNVSQLQEDQPGYDADLAESVRQVLEQRLLSCS